MKKRLETKEIKFTLTDMDDARGTFAGYASIFDVVDSYGDIVVRGAFKKTLREKKQFPILWSHNIMEPLGVIRGQEDERGLAIEGQLNLDVQRGREIRSLMKPGAVNGLSIGYQVVKEAEDAETRARLLKEINLWEVSPCVFQACPDALVGEVKAEELEILYGPALELEELKPYPNEHSARLQDPDKFDKIRRKADGTLFNKVKVPSTIDVLWGHLKDGEADDWAAQALRFPTKDWTAAEAKKWLKDNEVKYIAFEPATDSATEPGDPTPKNTIKPETLHLLDETLANLKRLSENL